MARLSLVASRQDGGGGVTPLTRACSNGVTMSRFAESLLSSRRHETLVHRFTNTMTYEKGAKPSLTG